MQKRGAPNASAKFRCRLWLNGAWHRGRDHALDADELLRPKRFLSAGGDVLDEVDAVLRSLPDHGVASEHGFDARREAPLQELGGSGRRSVELIRDALRVGQGAELLLALGAQIPQARRDHGEGCVRHRMLPSTPERLER